jgi:two-component system, chemotaxis family, protein-glutamate methylesterase/glutaminase
MKVLIVEDNQLNAHLLENILKEHQHDVVTTYDGLAALEKLKHDSFDAVITDWMMPTMDGTELIRRIREEVTLTPVILMTTIIQQDEAKKHIIETVGADEYLLKPYNKDEILSALATLKARKDQPLPASENTLEAAQSIEKRNPFFAVGVVASTGGPAALKTVLQELALQEKKAACFVVLHGPQWMLETFALSLQESLSECVLLAKDNMLIQPGKIYLATNEKHMIVEKNPTRLKLVDSPPQNFCIPSADPLFKSLADVFGSQSMAVIMTGLGRDGAMGAASVKAVGGHVMVQDPETCVATGMVQTILDMNLEPTILPLEDMSQAINRMAKKSLQQLAVQTI